jgi:hypothetical protein
MPSLATLNDVRALVEAAIDIADVDLQAIIDREEAEMVAKFGAHGDGTTAVTEVVPRVNGMAFLSRPAVSVTSVAEAAYPGGTATTLAASAYYAWVAEGRIQFYPGGVLLTANDDRTTLTVIYVPKDDRPRRRAILIELVRLAVERRAERSRTAKAGASEVLLSQTFVDFERERARLYRRLAPVGF